MKKIKVTLNAKGNYNCFIGTKKVVTLENETSAKEWLASCIVAYGPHLQISDKSLFSKYDVAQYILSYSLFGREG